MVNQHLSPVIFSSLNCFHFIFFLKFVVFSLGPIGYKNQVYNYIPGFYSCYVLSKQWPNYSSHLGEFFISWHNNNYNN